MTVLTDTQVITASGGLVELGYQSTDRTNVAVSATTSSGATELVSTTVVCDGGPILIEFQCCIACATGEGVAFRVWIDGVDTAGFAGNTNSQTNRETYFQTVRLQPAAGSRTISIRWYRWTGSTVLTSLTGNAILRVSKIVQATQWPAVTTGTIICTSSTRPASPFEGQTIWEGDTDRTYVWNGAAWVSPSVSYKPPMCRAVRTSDTSYTSNTAFTWQSVASSDKGFDTDGMFSAGSATRLTVKTAGVYHVTFQPYITTSGGTYSQAYIRMNGGTVLAETDSSTAIAGTVLTNVSVTYPFAVNDYIEGFAVVNGTSPTQKGVTVPSFISAVWIGNT